MTLIEEAKKQAVLKYGPDPMTGYPHVIRITAHIKNLAKTHDADEELLEIAAIFHDIAFDGKNTATHAKESADICDTFLRDNNYPNDKRNRINLIIRRHTLRDWTMEGKPATTEEKILFDAETLERLTLHGFLRFITTSSHLPYNDTKQIIKAAEKFTDENYSAIFFDDTKNKANKSYLTVKNMIAQLKQELNIQ